MTKDEARQFVRETLAYAEKLTAIVPGQVDDNIVCVLKQVVENDFLFDLLWSLVDQWLEEGEPLIVRGDGAVEAAAKEAGINPLVLIQVAQLVYQIWKLLRK